MRIIDLRLTREAGLFEDLFKNKDVNDITTVRAEESIKIFGEVLTPELASAKILSDVKVMGDDAVKRYMNLIDGVELSEFEVTKQEINSAKNEVSGEFIESLKKASKNIEEFHNHQLSESWFYEREDGTFLGQKITPINRAGIYVPGGTASYPSTVLMCIIPAKIGGCSNIIVTTPPGKDGKVPAETLIAAEIAGADRVFKIGGAQAIGAMAYGTGQVPKVDVIAGPGNAFVTEAKRQVYGVVGIDMIAGPSEIGIIADGTVPPNYAACDMLSQAEHDPDAVAILLTPDPEYASEVNREIKSKVSSLLRAGIAEESLKRNGAIIITSDLDQAFNIVNKWAPEHLELLIENSRSYIDKVKNAGALFLGSYSPEPIGDFIAGTNHVLPTSGTARFSSGIGVDTFQKRMSVIEYTKQGLDEIMGDAVRFAEVEGLEAHGLAVKERYKKRA